ncbi:hypothetical protein H3T72_gp01 [Enterococcus phage vB_EfaP_Ef7.3]|uniref:Uncharacterized protein n=1 Tax=Enterococcus phage vB_EfaP_Ef7.3 TaxID=2546619 RepID=A0A4D6DSH9_9CAUD|nr:hypothetical protein H3T72_gp01 [Enterococcus phage vB_EfaP_Ef7.3]QBZ69052.1 hypothetical protein [Enterococcus phage vB_EfaP_Ef7.3]
MKVRIIKPTLLDIEKGIAYGTELEIVSTNFGFINVKYFEEVVPFLPYQIEYI